MKSLVYKNNRGQLIVEYVLLLSIAAVVSAIVVSKLASRDPDSPGAIVSGWSKVVQSIGTDVVDDCLKPSCPN
mgnify:CR=1 FL=1|jgi:uncharacterized protein (UPF0333 family)